MAMTSFKIKYIETIPLNDEIKIYNVRDSIKLK